MYVHGYGNRTPAGTSFLEQPSQTRPSQPQAQSGRYNTHKHTHVPPCNPWSPPFFTPPALSPLSGLADSCQTQSGSAEQSASLGDGL